MGVDNLSQSVLFCAARFGIEKLMNRIDRLVGIVVLLQSRKIVRAEDIAKHFNMSLRTVYRDMKALGEAGVPIAAEAGEGYSLVEGYHLPPVMFTADEASALMLGGKFLEKLTDRSMVENAQSALLKIQAVLPEQTQERWERLQEATEVFLRSGEGQPGFRKDSMTFCQEAIAQRRVISMEYYSGYREAFSSREVEPLGLLFYSNHWHLIAYCRFRQDFRDFRTDRMKRIVVMDEHYQPRPDHTLQRYLENFNKMEDPVRVEVKFDRSIATYVRERQNFGLIEEQEVEDGVIMTYLVPRLEMMVHQVLAHGTLAVVLSPPKLREQLKKTATSVAQQYR